MCEDGLRTDWPPSGFHRHRHVSLLTDATRPCTCTTVNLDNRLQTQSLEEMPTSGQVPEGLTCLQLP